MCSDTGATPFLTVRFEGHAAVSERFLRDMHETCWEQIGPIHTDSPPAATFIAPYDDESPDMLREAIQKIEGAYGVKCLSWLSSANISSPRE